MPLKKTREVIDGAVVIRCNGNNPAGAHEARGTGSRAAFRAKALKGWQKKEKAARDRTNYARWLLDG